MGSGEKNTHTHASCGRENERGYVAHSDDCAHATTTTRVAIARYANSARWYCVCSHTFTHTDTHVSTFNPYNPNACNSACVTHSRTHVPIWRRSFVLARRVRAHAHHSLSTPPSSVCVCVVVKMSKRAHMRAYVLHSHARARLALPSSRR